MGQNSSSTHKEGSVVRTPVLMPDRTAMGNSIAPMMRRPDMLKHLVLFRSHLVTAHPVFGLFRCLWPVLHSDFSLFESGPRPNFSGFGWQCKHLLNSR